MTNFHSFLLEHLKDLHRCNLYECTKKIVLAVIVCIGGTNVWATIFNTGILISALHTFYVNLHTVVLSFPSREEGLLHLYI